MSDKTKKTAFRKRNYILPLMLTAVLLVVLLGVLFVTSMDKQIYIQRRYSMEQNAQKSSQLVNLSIKSEWEKLHQLVYTMQRFPASTSKQLMDSLADEQKQRSSLAMDLQLY